MGEKTVPIRVRAEAAAEYGSYTGLGKSSASQSLEIPEPAILLAPVETVFSPGISVDEPLPDLGPDLERPASDPRPYPRQDAPRWHTHRSKGRLEDAVGQPAPAGVGRGDDPAVISGEQDRQTVGGQDGAHESGVVYDDTIRNGPIRRIIDRPHDLAAVTLVQPQRL